VRDSAQHPDPSLTLFEVAYLQARRVDKSNAGGVSHRYANTRIWGPAGRHQSGCVGPSGL